MTLRRVAAASVCLLALAGCYPRSRDIVRGHDAFQRGFTALRRHEDDTAERYLDLAASYMPDDPFVQLDLGVVRQRLGKLDQARVAYARAIELGKAAEPRQVTDPAYAGQNVAQLAAEDLASMDQAPGAAK
jgi:Flp pilus assembly protein TadD